MREEKEERGERRKGGDRGWTERREEVATKSCGTRHSSNGLPPSQPASSLPLTMRCGGEQQIAV